MTSENKPLISLIIPIYKVEKYLPECLDSVLAQSNDKWEAIAVDDASPDACPDIVDSYARGDVRIKAIHLGKNSGTFIARKRGVELAQGKYIMFLDGDDSLMPEAFEIMLGAEQEDSTDIIQYGGNIKFVDGISEESKAAAENYFKNIPNGRSNNDLLEYCFFKRKMNWSLALKCFKSDVCKKGFSLAGNIRVISMEDVYAFFFITRCAKSFRIISDRLLNYKYGIGSSTVSKWNYEGFKHDTCEREAFLSIKDYIIKNNLEERYPTFISMLLEWIMRVQLGRLSAVEGEHDFLAALKLLEEQWGADTLCKYLEYLPQIPFPVFKQLLNGRVKIHKQVIDSCMPKCQGYFEQLIKEWIDDPIPTRQSEEGFVKLSV